MRQTTGTLDVRTQGRSLIEITREIAGWVTETGISQGLLTVLCRHTSASLLITENASPEVWRDLERWLDAAAPEGQHYEHSLEGPDDMPAHIKATLTGVTLNLPVASGRMALGTWQGIFLAEHRRNPHRRNIALHLIGE